MTQPMEEHWFRCRGLRDLIAREDDLLELWRPHKRAVATYRFFEQGPHYDLLLYVGITKSPPSRFRQHIAGKPWTERVDLVLVDWYQHRCFAALAEGRAIRHEAPAFNIWPAANIDELGASRARVEAGHRVDFHPFAHHTYLRYSMGIADCAPTAFEEVQEV